LIFRIPIYDGHVLALYIAGLLAGGLGWAVIYPHADKDVPAPLLRVGCQPGQGGED
jgi:hypothetical protein